VSTHEVWVDLSASRERRYPVRVGPDALMSLARDLPRWAPAHTYALISDRTVMPRHGEKLAGELRGGGHRVETFTIPSGEEHKTRAEWARLTDAMLARELGRDTAVLALGGGVVGDMAGFAAATFMRGLPVVQLPTTLLAMVDASVGGKTGVDTAAGKNLVGAFHPPRAVVADTRLLDSLPEDQLRSGLAEAIKHGLIADADYLEWTETAFPRIIAGDDEARSALVARSVEIKAGVVSRDEREGGERKILNFGHTVGHAVEAVTGYSMLHGCAVGIGMVVEAEVGERLGVTEPGVTRRIREVLAGAGLPHTLPADVDPERVLAAARSDKKSRQGLVEYALLRRVGSADPGEDGRWSRPVPESLVREALGALGPLGSPGGARIAP
jgi:3-dehydroquinate synthase